MNETQAVSTAFLGSIVLILNVSVVPAAEAQAIGAATAGDAGDALQEIIVTAEKRPEEAQRIAISISTLSGDDLARRGEVELDTALRNVPSLQIQTTAQGGEFYIRGVGANGDSNYVDPAVALSIDGVYNGRSERLAAPLYDINRIEVLRGPQGTLAGRNAEGGAVNVLTNGPVIGNSETRLDVNVGNYDLAHIDVAQNIPVNDELAFRVAAMREDRHGYFTNDGYASHVAAFRVKGLYEPTENLSIQLLFDYSHQSGLWATTVPAPLPFAGPPPPVYNSTSDPKCAGPSGGWLITQPNNPWYVDPCHPADSIDYKFETVALQVDYRTPWGTVTFIPTYLHDTRDDLTGLVVGNDPFFGGTPTAADDSENQKTVELRITSPAASPIKWVVGYYFLRTDDGGTFGALSTFSGTVTGTSNAIALYNTNSEGAPAATSKAPYGQITYPITDTFRVTGGLRYTQDSKSQAVRIVSIAIPGYDSGRDVVTNAYSATNYKAGVEYDMAPKSMLYAQVTTGYKAGGFDTTTAVPESYQPEHIKAYELGIKNRFLNDSLQINADVYYYDYADLQVQYANPSGNPLPIPTQYIPTGVTYRLFQQFIVNAATGKNKGAELETRYRFTRNDELDLSITYARALYGNFSIAALQRLNGQPIAMTPEDTAILNYEHDWLFASGKVAAQVDSKWSSSYLATVNNRASAYGFQKAYSRSDASLAYDANSHWSLTAWVKNIENKAQTQEGDYPLNRVFINFPRTYGVNLGLKF